MLKTTRRASLPTALNKLLLVAIASSISLPAVAACFKQSPAHTVALLELYTSEGCDSCPPANEWLSEQSKQFTADQLVTLALHVDYWDYIGWKDQFASPAFGQRHKATVHANGSKTVYTPEFFVSGKETRNWRQHGVLAQRVGAANAKTATAAVSLSASSAGREASVKAVFKAQTSNALGYFAVLENQLATHVTKGENAGVTLKEDRVVRKWFGPYPVGADKNGTVIERTFSLPQSSPLKQLSLAAFVQDAATGAILQATASQVGDCF